MLNVAVNLLWLAPGRVGGSEEYLVRQLDAVADAVSLTVYAQPAFAAAHPDLAARVTVVPGPLRRDRRPQRIVAEHTWLARRTARADVVHHGGGTAPAIGNRHTVLTVHDLQYLAHPDYFSRTRLAYLRATMPSSCRRATVIATPSDFVRGTVVDAFGRDPATVVTVPHPVPDIARPSDAEVARVQRRYGVRSPYVIYPAITHPHKGHTVLVDLLAATARPGHPLADVQLVLTGSAGAHEQVVDDAIRRAGVADRVARLGRVPAGDRDALVAGAAALVFPSEYEGFGAPLVEAMSLGVPVVCRAAAAVPEVVGDAAVVVDDATGEAWAAAVETAFEDPRRLVDAGFERRRAYTPETAAAALLDAYARAAA